MQAFTAWCRRVSMGLTLSPMSKNYLALSFPLFTEMAVLLKKYWDYQKKSSPGYDIVELETLGQVVLRIGLLFE